MPSLHNLNPPPNPFWDFVVGLEDHPFFRAQHPGQQQPNEAGEASTTQQEPQMSEKTQGKQPEAEDPPEVDPSTLNKEKSGEKTDGAEGPGMRFRGRGRFAGAFDEDGTPRRGHGCPGRGGFGGRGGHPHHGPPSPWAFHHGPWWGRHGPGPHRGGPPHHHRGPPPPNQDGPSGFNLPEFLNTLGQRLGIDLSGAAEGLGLDRFVGPHNSDADFEPRADVFDTPSSYLIHVSLPGAKKEDVGVDWDGENSHIRIAGVVHRPGADEQLLSQLVVDGRKRETGVFEKLVRLGTRREPASIDVSGITAKMADGVLVVKVPKAEVEHRKRDVPISAATPSPARGAEKEVRFQEKESLIDADEDMYDAATGVNAGLKEKEKEAEHQREVEANPEHDVRSETMDYEHPEQLPKYQAEGAEDEEWEKADEEEEGDYVKINVD